MTIEIYTDGACEVHLSNIGGWGVVLSYKDYIRKHFGGEKNTTNNRMEIKAVIEALKCIKTKSKPIRIYSDSALVVNCFKNKWYKKWQKNGWRTNKRSVKNIDLWQELIPLVERQENIKFVKVKGHAGIELNELADELANFGIELEKKKLN